MGRPPRVRKLVEIKPKTEIKIPKPRLKSSATIEPDKRLQPLQTTSRHPSTINAAWLIGFWNGIEIDTVSRADWTDKAIVFLTLGIVILAGMQWRL